LNRLGDILHIDLSTGASERLPYDEATARRVLGGRGFGIDELWRVPAAADPLSPANPIVLAPGLLVGSGAPSASRVQLTARSPLTGLLGSSNLGGEFGFVLRAAGLSALVLRGRAPRLSVLSIADGGVELQDAAKLRGLETHAALAALVAGAPGGGGDALVIGPAGENLSPLACIVGRRGHVAGRTGLGAVLGAKNLKGIVAQGENETEPVASEARTRLARDYLGQIVAARNFREFSTYGSTAGVEWGNERGLLSTRNYATGSSPEALAVDSAAIHQFTQRRSGCRHCPVKCKAEVRVTEAGGDVLGQRPDFEPIVALGPNLGIADPAAVLRLHNRCDALGLDSISVGSAIAFAIDVFERGIITERETGGLALRWGDVAAVEALVEGMAGGEGFAGLLAMGVRRAADELGHGTDRYAYHVKGLELSAYDPRAAWATALGYVVSSRGGDYASVYAHHEFDLPEGYAELLYGDPDTGDPRSPAGKAELVRRSLIVSAVVDALGLCKVPALSLLNRFDLELEAGLTEGFMGLPVDADGLWRIGERIVTMERLFNLHCGASAEHDKLPTRFTERGLESSPASGVIELAGLRGEFYALMGWSADGVPTADTLARLGLSPEPRTSA
jgi:aldehyde:ferredoxin oxidoreductase